MLASRDTVRSRKFSDSKPDSNVRSRIYYGKWEVNTRCKYDADRVFFDSGIPISSIGCVELITRD